MCSNRRIATIRSTGPVRKNVGWLHSRGNWSPLAFAAYSVPFLARCERLVTTLAGNAQSTNTIHYRIFGPGTTLHVMLHELHDCSAIRQGLAKYPAYSLQPATTGRPESAARQTCVPSQPWHRILRPGHQIERMTPPMALELGKLGYLAEPSVAIWLDQAWLSDWTQWCRIQWGRAVRPLFLFADRFVQLRDHCYVRQQFNGPL